MRQFFVAWRPEVPLFFSWNGLMCLVQSVAFITRPVAVLLPTSAAMLNWAGSPYGPLPSVGPANHPGKVEEGAWHLVSEPLWIKSMLLGGLLVIHNCMLSCDPGCCY